MRTIFFLDAAAAAIFRRICRPSGQSECSLMAGAAIMNYDPTSALALGSRTERRAAAPAPRYFQKRAMSNYDIVGLSGDAEGCNKGCATAGATAACHAETPPPASA